MADSDEDGRPSRPSLEDEIFAVASTVEVDRPEDGPRIRVRARPPWEWARGLTRRDVGATLAGFLTFVFVDLVMMYAPLMASRRPSLLPQMITLLVLAFGLGGLLVWKVGGAGRLFGIGMMLAWVFLTLVSVGFLTGLTP
ncbi:hypothetical protein Acsp04_43720 [Actinomadura sp. NBRC 104425]|uniref:hypothetical protein n=1 Tax=Actinomadura sp. NBRC 104425 TaxID=3032204 RepID=UPI0024A2AFD0|nr:hypothetical protein [Actinomadura sp. NBRC 104425]GLZ14137.1 hypothetical protein Acsp04_43720 [Actinomadura sp. NBRC 104425]